MSFGWGIAGCGWIARDYVAPAIAASDNGRLVAVASLGERDVHRIAPDSAIRRTIELDAFLSTPGLDGVYVATPNDAHAEWVEASAAAGKHVLCEKPMATSLLDATNMVTACQDAGVLYATAFNQRFHPAHLHLRELVRDGLLGTVTQVRIRYACETPPWWGADDWHFDPAQAGGGALFDLAPHGLDLIGVLLGRELREVTALRQRALLDHPVEDGAAVVARYHGDVLATIQVAYTTPETLPRRELEVIGTAGMVIASDTMGQDAGGSLTFVDASDGRSAAVAYERSDQSPFRLEVEAFADAASGGSAFEWAPEWDLRVMSALEAAMSTSGVLLA